MTDQKKLDIHYAEYLRVKDAIADTAMELNYCSARDEFKDMAVKYQRDMDALLERFSLVLEQLETLAVKPITLLLLSVGVKMDLLDDPSTTKPTYYDGITRG